MQQVEVEGKRVYQQVPGGGVENEHAGGFTDGESGVFTDVNSERESIFNNPRHDGIGQVQVLGTLRHTDIHRLEKSAVNS